LRLVVLLWLLLLLSQNSRRDALLVDKHVEDEQNVKGCIARIRDRNVVRHGN
jgi:hypothetical protein